MMPNHGKYLKNRSARGDKLEIKAGDVLRLADAVTVTIDGDALLNPVEVAKILPADARRGIYCEL